MEGVKITERGWAGHFICAHYCSFRRNTLIEYANKKIVVSTVGGMRIWNHDTGESKIEAIGLNRYYETMAFVGKNEGGYIDADVSKPVVFESEWGIFGKNKVGDCMQLSKTESKYRTKIIQEQHLKKINQIWLDYFCKNISYKDFYLSGARPPKVNNLIQATMNITKQLKKFTSSFMTIATKSFDEFAQAIREVIQ